MAKLIIITGAPASGKSTICEQLALRTGISYISKDSFKIALFEKYGFNSHKEKKALSLLGEEQMYNVIKGAISANKNLIVDNNFRDFKRIREAIEGYNVTLYCVLCRCSYELLAQRYNERILSGLRHQALYTLNHYPVEKGKSIFHPVITAKDVENIQSQVEEACYGDYELFINTDNIRTEFDSILDRIFNFIKQ